MALTPTRLAAARPAAGAEVSLYTAPAAATAARVIVKQVSVATGATAATVTLSLRTAAGAAGLFPIVDGRLVDANDTVVLDLSLVLEPGNQLVSTGTAVVTVIASGLVDAV